MKVKVAVGWAFLGQLLGFSTLHLPAQQDLSTILGANCVLKCDNWGLEATGKSPEISDHPHVSQDQSEYKAHSLSTKGCCHHGSVWRQPGNTWLSKEHPPMLHTSALSFGTWFKILTVRDPSETIWKWNSPAGMKQTLRHLFSVNGFL